MAVRARDGVIGVEHDLKGAAMGFLHRHHDGSATRYRMREKIFAIGDDFWIEDGRRRAVFKVDGKALRVRDTFILKDATGRSCSRSRRRSSTSATRWRSSATGHRGDGQEGAHTPLRDHFAIELDGGAELKAKGNIVDHEYEIERDGRHGGRGLQEVVPGPRDVRHPDRPGPGRRADPGDHRVHRRDGGAIADDAVADVLNEQRVIAATRLRPAATWSSESSHGHRHAVRDQTAGGGSRNLRAKR